MFLNTICEKSYIQMIYVSGFFHIFALEIRFLRRDGCFCLTVNPLQIFNNQFVYLVYNRSVN